MGAFYGMLMLKVTGLGFTRKVSPINRFPVFALIAIGCPMAHAAIYGGSAKVLEKQDSSEYPQL